MISALEHSVCRVDVIVVDTVNMALQQRISGVHSGVQFGNALGLSEDC